MKKMNIMDRKTQFWTPEENEEPGLICPFVMELTGEIVLCKYAKGEVEYNDHKEICGYSAYCDMPPEIDCVYQTMYDME